MRVVLLAIAIVTTRAGLRFSRERIHGAVARSLVSARRSTKVASNNEGFAQIAVAYLAPVRGRKSNTGSGSWRMAPQWSE